MTQDKAGGKWYLLGGEEEKGDGDTAQTRQLEMRQDTLFTALFQSTQEIANPGTGSIRFTLTPNPTQGNCLLEIMDALPPYADCQMTVVDAQEHKVLKVTLFTPKGTSANGWW